LDNVIRAPAAAFEKGSIAPVGEVIVWITANTVNSCELADKK